MRRYAEQSVSISEGLSADILTMQSNDPDCASRTGPILGYKLGMFVAEELIIDFGLAALADSFSLLGDQPLREAFAQAAGQGYEDWVFEVLIPYLEAESAPFSISRGLGPL